MALNGEFIGNVAFNGGAVYINSSASNSIINSTFINNSAYQGGAVFFNDETSGNVIDGYFEGNVAERIGGAICFQNKSCDNVISAEFNNNRVNGASGGAIFFRNVAENNSFEGSFTNNYAVNGGAIFFYNKANNNRFDSDFMFNLANSSGGAIVFFGTSDMNNFTGCFVNNSALGVQTGEMNGNGGAITFRDVSSNSVFTCDFINNTAVQHGGAVNYRLTPINITFNGNFVDNHATYGGAINFIESIENVALNGEFIGNHAEFGGALYINGTGTVSDCNFTNNSAKFGGALYIYDDATVSDCNFIGNNATTGSAIYFYSTSATKTVSNSRFLNNRANAEALEVTKNDNNITITFTGNDNLLNAIYSRNDAEVTVTNVTYWSANGITTTGSSAIKPSRSNKEAGQNITVGVVVNGELVLSGVYLTDENGMIVLDISAGDNYFIGARHDTDSYYTEALKTISNNTKFSVNITSQTTNNRTVNITAKSNIPNEVIDGKFLFILPNSEEISANYGGNGTWWAVHTFDDYGVYEVNASYTGLDNVTVNNGTVTINDVRLSVVKSADATEVTYNSTVQFTINITNYGSTDATSVEVSDWLPEGLTFIEAGVINSEGQYEVFDSLDLLILIDDEEFVTFFEFSSSDIIEDGGVERDIAQWSITRIAGGNSVILLITARANGLVMGNITNEVTVWYHENETDSIVNSTNITVIPANSSVSAEDVTVNFGEAISIPVSSANATEISYSIIDANNKAVANGTVKPGSPISVSDLAAGDYTVSLTTFVDTNHTSVSNSSKLHIRHVVSIVIAPVTGYAGEVVSFTAQFKYENGDLVNEGTAGLTIKYEDKELLAASMYSILSADESTSVSDGKATFNVKLGDPGIYPYVISYSGGDADDVQSESTLTVLKVNTAVSGIDVSGKPSDKKDVAVTVLDHNNNPVANGTVTLTLNGKTYNATVENGKAVLSIELPNPGEYNATVTYNGNGYYNSSSSSIAVDVEKVNTKAPSTDDVSGKAGEKKDIPVKFVDENGNPVKNGTATLTVDGKTYTAEVINGVATFKDVVIPDEDTVADVYYQGNDYYNSSSTTISIKVKQENNTEPDNNDTDENKTTKHVSSEIADVNATGNPIAMMLLALCALVITYRKK